MISATLAVEHFKLSEMILQGSITVSARAARKGQLLVVGIPYLRSIAPNGRVTDETLWKAMEGPGGEIAKCVVWLCLDPVAKQKGEFTVDKALDQNSDNAISIIVNRR